MIIKIYIMLFFLFIVNLSGKEKDISEISDPPKSEKSESENLSLWERDSFTGTWGGLRNNLLNKGFNFNITLTIDLFSNIDELSKKNFEYFTNINISSEIDLDKLAGLNSSRLFINFIGNKGKSPSSLVNSIQGVSNIEAIQGWNLFQLFLEKTFFEEKVSLLFGLYEINNEFDVRETTLDFLTPSYGIGCDFSNSGINGPSTYPYTSLTLRVGYSFNQNNQIKIAILDGVPGDPNNLDKNSILLKKEDGLLIVGEYSYLNSIEELINGKISFGGWFYTNKLPAYSSEIIPTDIISYQNNYGFFLSFEKELLSFKNERRLSGFLRTGYANEKINPIKFSLSTGLNLENLVNLFVIDKLLLGLSYVSISEDYIERTLYQENINLYPSEINLEITYLAYPTPWLKIQPNVQVVFNPIFSEKKSISIFGIRTSINL